MQELVAGAAAALTARWRCGALVHRAGRVVSVAENYDALGYGADAPARERRYTRYVDATRMLRAPRAGREVEVLAGGEWVELLECGLAHPAVLAAAGLGAHGGLAMGIGLDRAVMLRKGVADIRLLRSPDPRVAAQMRDLTPYQPVSSQPPARRDVSVACPRGWTDEDLGDRVRDALGAEASEWVEEVAVVSRTPAAQLPQAARSRLAIAPDQENLLVRVVLRHPTRSLAKPEANALRDRIYDALHRG